LLGEHILDVTIAQSKTEIELVADGANMLIELRAERFPSIVIQWPV